jgi:hypothetical protein
MEERLKRLETAQKRVVEAVFGNGHAGMDERLRRLEEAQARNEKARVIDAEHIYERLEQLQTQVTDLVGTLREQAGGWQVAKIGAGFGIPLILGLLSFIAYRLSVVMQ